MMGFIRRLVCYGFLFASTCSAAFAADGSSGCGPAWYILKDNSLLSSFGRSLTNGFLSPVVTIGMTFGTSNCAKHSLVLNEKEGLQFIASNYDQVKVDVAQGSGEYLNNLAGLLGCEQPEALGSVLQANFAAIYAGVPPAEGVLARMGNVVGEYGAAAQCGAI